MTRAVAKETCPTTGGPAAGHAVGAVLWPDLREAPPQAGQERPHPGHADRESPRIPPGEHDMHGQMSA
jgi:hypothetical protein